MRSIISFLLLSACSDYEMVGRHEEPADVPATETDGEEPEVIDVGDTAAETDTATVPVEDTEEDTGDEPISSTECGFLVSEGYGQETETESLAVFTVVGDTELEIRPGETARYQFAVTALECGDIDLNLVIFEVQDETCWYGDCWINGLATSYIPMYLSNLTDGITYEPYDLSQQVNNLMYVWKDEVSNSGQPLNGVNGNMDTIPLAAGTTKILEFEFTATDTIPVGSVFRIFLTDPFWTDITTGNTVRDWSGGGTDVAVTFTVVE